ncbi:MAG: arylesterase [Alphaproteobacteria bacterium]
MTTRIVHLIAALLAAVSVSAGAAQAEQIRLMVLGDSLTSGYGLPPDHGFTVQLESALQANGLDVVVLNAGVSGDTTAGGLARLDWALADEPTHVIVELGSNDGLRGIDPGSARENLDAILQRLDQENIPVLLAGMLAPPNFGSDYAAEFNAMYPELAEQHDVPLYPFFLDGVATVPTLNQSDRIHPNARGVAEIVDRMLPTIIRWLESDANA